VSARLSARLTQVSILFFLWGFAYALVGSLSVQIQNLLPYPPSHTIALHDAYRGAYIVGPLLVGYWALKREGFKATFMTGLAIFAQGRCHSGYHPSCDLTLASSSPTLSSPSAFPALAANLFISLAGPGELSEARLNFAQRLNGVCATVSPIVAQVALFAGTDQLYLFRVQWRCFTIALFVVTLAIIFYYVPLSEAGDDDLETTAPQRLYNAGLDPRDKAFDIRVRLLVLWSGLLAAWFY
jgi:fucose permease